MAQGGTNLKRRSILKSLVGELQKEGAKVTHAALDGYTDTYKIGRYKPDVIAIMPNGQAVVGIVRLGGSDIETGQNRQQIKDLATRISQKTHKVIPLYIGIPSNISQDLNRVLKEVGLDKKPNIRIRTY